MPTFDGQLTEEQVLALISYIKAIGPPPGSQQPTSPGTAPDELREQRKGSPARSATSISGTKPGKR